MSGLNFITGWTSRVRARVNSWLFTAVLFASATLWAEEVEVPPLELLEYLGEWEDGNGQWVEPQLLQLAMPHGEAQANGEEQANEEANDE